MPGEKDWKIIAAGHGMALDAHFGGEEAPLIRGAVGIEENFTGLAGFEELKGFGEAVEGQALIEERLEIEASGLEKRSHLLPSLEHFAAIDSLHGRALENHVTDEI